MRRFFGLLAFVLVSLAGLAPARAGLDIRVDLAAQRMSVTTGDGERHVWTISSGRKGFRSPNGVYRPTRLEKNWYSRKYGGAMPHAVFFRGGYAIHGTTAVGALGRPASHGCIRLHPANAAKLFALVRKHGVGATRIALGGTAPDGLSRFAKAAPAKKQGVVTARAGAKTTLAKFRSGQKAHLARGGAQGKPQLAKARARGGQPAALAAGMRTAPGWGEARGQILLRPAIPAEAYGFQPYAGPGWR
jgi:hypothetical protein